MAEDDVAELRRDVRVALLDADVSLAVAKEFTAQVKDEAGGEDIFGSLTPDQTMIKLIRDELIALLGESELPFNWSPSPPTVVLMCGLQGSGKTTTTAKLAKHLMRQGKKVMLAACDVQRPAAVQQLQILGEQVGAPVFVGDPGTSPLYIDAAALERCRYLMLDVLILDTAGRLSIDDALMVELREIRSAVKLTE